MKQFQSEGRTILVVTHSSDIVRQVCNRAIVLDHGQLIADGKPADAITIFREHLHGTLIDDTPHRSARVHLDEVRVLDHGDDQVRLEVEVMAVEPTDGVMLSVEVTDKGNRLVYRVDSSQLGMPVHLDEGSTQFAFDLNVSPLLGGTYPCTIRLIEAETGRLLDWHDLQTGVNVTRSTAGEGVADLGAALLRRTHPVDHPA